MPTTPPVFADPVFLALQTALAGRFSLEGELGRGGMGIVFLARDVILERRVAIKLLAPALAVREEMRQRFLREARLAAQCFHPNIVPIHEVAEAGTLAWFVMGYVQGETLADRLRRTGPLPAEQVRRIGRDIGWALAYAHERGVVHRDVKPENILLEQGSARALIADFGIALVGHGADHEGDIAGTVRYMAPEQALGEPLDGRADLYALGVTLHLAATGRYPHDGATAIAVVTQQHTQPVTSIRAHAALLPAAVADAIDQCLALRPAERFDSAARFVEALDRTPDGGELPTEARAARAAAQGAMTLADWTVAIAYAGFCMVLGEESGSLGRALMKGVTEGIVTFAAVATAVRGGEALLAARTALKRGVAAHDVVDALAPPPTPPLHPVKAGTGLALLLGGAALAFAQAQLDPLGLPATLEFLGNTVTWIAPPFLIHRALTGMRHGSGHSGWLYSFVRRPLAQRVVRWLGGRESTTPPRVPPLNAPTEVMLGRAADAILARLPDAVRADLGSLPSAMAALAEEATRLRGRASELSAEGRRLRLHQYPAAAIEDVEREQAVVQARLGTAIAALEGVRLDLLRLEAGRTLPGALTEQLEAVRELHRRVDAVADVQRALHPLRPEPTPV